jgi:hypothetical protein
VSELTRLANGSRKYAREWKVTTWTLGVGFVFWVVADAKGGSGQVEGILIGALLGFGCGLLVSRRLKRTS